MSRCRVVHDPWAHFGESVSAGVDQWQIVWPPLMGLPCGGEVGWSDPGSTPGPARRPF
jgi:hypothetical protein